MRSDSVKVGQIIIDKESIIIDAEPYVMAKIRPLFQDIKIHKERGKYTHNPIGIPNTLNNMRDARWILDRFPLHLEEEHLQQLNKKSEEYDSILASVQNADKDSELKLSTESYKPEVEPKEHQVQFLNMALKVKRILLADKLGIGKTIASLLLLADPKHRPAVIVAPVTLLTQWDREIKRLYPGMTTHTIKGTKPYDLPLVDVFITSYNRLSYWQDTLLSRKDIYTVIFDEVHELRHTDTNKRHGARILSENAQIVAGLSATPIFNKGDEIWSVLDVINPKCLGSRDSFVSEWCDWNGSVREPAVLHNFLKNQGLFLRRGPEEIGMTFGQTLKHVYTIDADLDKLKEVQDIAKTLALAVLSGNVGLDSDSAREFDWKLRHATGVAKAKAVAEFVKMICETGEKVLLSGWHRDFYDIVLKELKHLKPVMFTGSETIAQKDASIKNFVEGDSEVFIISLRSGAGIDGLQKVCAIAVFGELDWSPHVMDQVIGRLDRYGQTRPVQAYYLTVADGSDPFIVQTLNIKRSQHDGLVEGKEGEAQVLLSSGPKDRVQEMAKHYLTSIGEEIPEIVEEEGLLKEIADLVRSVKLPHNSEDEMQRALEPVIKKCTLGSVEREYKISARSRIDFLAFNEKEKIAIELKVTNLKRTDVYKQVRRYSKESGITSVVLVAPWHGIKSFKVDGIPVVVVDSSVNSI